MAACTEDSDEDKRLFYILNSSLVDIARELSLRGLPTSRRSKADMARRLVNDDRKKGVDPHWTIAPANTAPLKLMRSADCKVTRSRPTTSAKKRLPGHCVRVFVTPKLLQSIGNEILDHGSGWPVADSRPLYHRCLSLKGQLEVFSKLIKPLNEQNFECIQNSGIATEERKRIF